MGQPWNQVDIQSMSRAERENIQVLCHSGYTYAERPESFIYRHEAYQIEEIERQWREPGETHFTVFTRDRKFFELCYNDHKGEWSLVEA